MDGPIGSGGDDTDHLTLRPHRMKDVDHHLKAHGIDPREVSHYTLSTISYDPSASP
jgi:hypothetical protein